MILSLFAGVVLLLVMYYLLKGRVLADTLAIEVDTNLNVINRNDYIYNKAEYAAYLEEVTPKYTSEDYEKVSIEKKKYKTYRKQITFYGKAGEKETEIYTTELKLIEPKNMDYEISCNRNRFIQNETWNTGYPLLKSKVNVHDPRYFVEYVTDEDPVALYSQYNTNRPRNKTEYRADYFTVGKIEILEEFEVELETFKYVLKEQK